MQMGMVALSGTNSNKITNFKVLALDMDDVLEDMIGTKKFFA